MKIKHNRHDTFFWVGEIITQVDGQAVDLSDYDISSQIRDKQGSLIATLTVHKDDPQPSSIRIQENSSGWAVGDMVWDIRLIKESIAVSTEQVQLTIYDGATYD